MSFTRAHLTRTGEIGESGIQRQLELEYAGYIPGFTGFEKNSEAQIVRNMVDLAKYTATMYGEAPVADGWRMSIGLTSERKYDFVNGKNAKSFPEARRSVALPSRSLELVFAN